MDDFKGIETLEAEAPAKPNGGRPPTGAAPGSVLDRLRKRREHLRSDRKFRIDIPGYGGELIAEYAAIDGAASLMPVALHAAGEGEAEAAVQSALNGITKMCVGLYVKDGDAVIPLNVVYELGPTPARYDSRLAEAFDFEADTASDVVRGMFPSDDAIETHALALLAFVQGADDEATEKLLGEA